MLLGLAVLVGAFKVGVKATSDGYATVKAAQSGQFDFIDADRQRRASQREKLAKAWAERRRRRHREAGGDGQFRPGARDYVGDLYHGFWEDRLKVRQEKRAARPEQLWDPARKPWHVRFDEAFMRAAAKARQAWDGRQIHQPLRDDPTSTVAVDEPDAAADDEAGYEPGTWTVNDAGEQVPLTANPPAAEPRPSRADAPVSTATPLEYRDAARRPAEPTDDTTEGETPMAETMTADAATEVNNNEDVRRAFANLAQLAAQGKEAAEVLEGIRRKLAATAQATTDGMGARAFDRGATVASAEAAEAISAADLSTVHGALDAVEQSAVKGGGSLDKYRDAEVLVGSEQVDGKTLETAGSV